VCGTRAKVRGRAHEPLTLTVGLMAFFGITSLGPPNVFELYRCGGGVQRRPVRARAPPAPLPLARPAASSPCARCRCARRGGARRGCVVPKALWQPAGWVSILTEGRCQAP